MAWRSLWCVCTTERFLLLHHSGGTPTLYFLLAPTNPTPTKLLLNLGPMSETTKSPIQAFLAKYNFKVAEASPEYLARRKKQMVLFTTAAAVTIFTSRFAYKSTITRQYVPSLFQGNHLPPLGYNFTTDAAVAVGTGTMLCASVSSMIAFGTCWVMDVSSFREFGWRMKSLLGGTEQEQKLAQMPMDDDTAYIQDGINDLLDGKIEVNFDEE